MTPQDLINAFEKLVDAPEGVKRLRELVLQLAVRGKLVPQDPADEPASVLLEQMAEEKGRRVETKTDRAIICASEPFDSPRGWVWATLGGIARVERGGSPRPIKDYITDDPDGLNWIKIGDTEQGGKYITSTKERIRREGLKKTRMVYPGDFLLTNSMSFGRPYITAIEGCIHDGWLRIHPPEALNKDYLYLVLSSPYIVDAFTQAAAGAVVLNLNADKVRDVPVPLPPLAEQHRIVEKVDSLMALLDQLEEARNARDATRTALRDAALSALQEADDTEAVELAWARIQENMNDLFTDPEDVAPLRQTILQLAVRGRLVPQDAEDEPASVLLEQIAEEKERLVKEKKIKKKYPLTPLSESEIDFSLPNGWIWARLSALVYSLRYGSAAKSEKTGKVPVLRMGNLQGGAIDWRDLKFTSDPEEIAKYAIPPMTVLFNRTNSPALVGKSAIYRGEQPAIFAGYLIRIETSPLIDPEYLNRVLQTPHAREWCWRVKTDGVSQSNISASKLAQFPFPLPPLAEQHRIVEKVDSLMALCDDLEARLTSAKELHGKMAEAAVHHLEIEPRL